MGIFKAYDIRGIYNQDFDKHMVYRIGFFLPKLLKADKVIIGRDVRISSPEIFEYLVKGVTDAGADVCSIGLATTPMVYFATAKHGFDASVQITASHNAKEYNGLKISTTDALPVGYDTGLATLEEMVKTQEICPAKDKGSVYEKDIYNEYVTFFEKYKDDFSNLKICVDCSNGMAAVVIKDVLGKDVQYIYDTLDGTFPNHEPNPLIEENVQDLKQLVKENYADIGIIFDGDADRVMFVDEKGKFISPDLMIAVIAKYFLGNNKVTAQYHILHDIRTSKSVSEYSSKLGSKVHMWKVGHAFAKRKLREIDGIFGGELAGHYYFRDFFYCDSGILAAMIVLNVVKQLKQEGNTLSSFIETINPYAYSGEINFKIENKQQAMETLKEEFSKQEEVTAFHDFDGYRVEFKTWWFNVRPSNTEPYLRLVVEAKDDKLLDNKLKAIKKILHQYSV